MKTIAERIKEGLEVRNMKQSELVAATGIGKSSISTYISGEYEPKQKNIYKIAHALNVSEAWLMGYDVPMHSGANEDYDLPDDVAELLVRLDTAPDSIRKAAIAAAIAVLNTADSH